jgi:LPXTG-motif cell wall-anchored protein
MFGNGTATVHGDACYNTSNPHIDVTDDGKTMTIVNDDEDQPGDQCGNLQYGGKIDGLKAGKAADGSNYKYTYTIKAKFQHEDCDAKHSGFYFCIGENLTTYDDNGRTITHIEGNGEGHTGAFGWWGHPYKSNGNTDMRYHTIKKDGSTIKNLTSSLSDEFKAAMKAGANEWYDVVIEIDGYKMNISFNGTELGWYDFTSDATAINGDSTDLAFITRVFNEDMTFTVKDVAIYKGIDIDFANLPEDTDAPETDAPETDAPETDAPATDDGMVYDTLKVALWTNVGGVGADNQLKPEQVANIKAGLEKVLTDAGYDLSKVSIEWIDLCADGGHGVEALVPLTNDGDFDVVLGAGTNAITKGLNAVELKPMVVENTKRQAVLIDDNNAMAKVLYEYITTGNTTGYPAPPQTGDASMFVAISLIAIISLGGAVLVSKKRFN